MSISYLPVGQTPLGYLSGHFSVCLSYLAVLQGSCQLAVRRQNLVCSHEVVQQSYRLRWYKMAKDPTMGEKSRQTLR